MVLLCVSLFPQEQRVTTTTDKELGKSSPISYILHICIGGGNSNEERVNIVHKERVRITFPGDCIAVIWFSPCCRTDLKRYEHETWRSWHSLRHRLVTMASSTLRIFQLCLCEQPNSMLVLKAELLFRVQIVRISIR